MTMRNELIIFGIFLLALSGCATTGYNPPPPRSSPVTLGLPPGGASRAAEGAAEFNALLIQGEWLRLERERLELERERLRLERERLNRTR